MKKTQRIMGFESSGLGPDDWHLAGILAVGLALCIGAGCSSTSQPASAGFASVVIQGRTHEQVRDATAEVFRGHGYKVMQNGWANLVFEREGSAMDKLAYGSWMEGSAWIRVKVSVMDASPDTCRLECQAFVVRGRGEVLEEEIKLRRLHRRQYQELLNEVAKRLGAPTTAPN